MSQRRQYDKPINEFGDSLKTELQALLRDQDRAVASELSSNLYSVYLYNLERQKTLTQYIKWPAPNAPSDPNFYMDDDETLLDSTHELDSYEKENDEVEGFEDPISPLTTAFDTYLKRQVYERIHMDGLEPIIDMDPRAGQLGIDLAYKVLTILNNIPPSMEGLISWKDLNIDDPRVINRMEELYPAREIRAPVHPREASDLIKMIKTENNIRTTMERFKVPYAPKPYDYEPRITLHQELFEPGTSDRETTTTTQRARMHANSVANSNLNP